ncbi:metal ABC transporter permease [Spirillospora sp. NPDC052242]
MRLAFAALLHDREPALCSGVSVGPLTVVLLVDALTLLPVLAARQLGRSLTSMAGWAIGCGLAFDLGGFALALLFDLPPGPVLVLFGGALTLLIHLVPKARTRP